MSTTLTDAERIEAQRRTVQKHVDGERGHDYVKVNDTFVKVDCACYQVVPGGAEFEGHDGVVGFDELLLPDLERGPRVGDALGRVRGSQAVPELGLLESGRR